MKREIRTWTKEEMEEHMAKKRALSGTLNSLVGYPMLSGKEMTPVFVIAENMAEAIEVIEASGTKEWEFQHTTSYRVIPNV